VNFVQCGVAPVTEAYGPLQPIIEYVHIKDARFSDGSVVLADQGDGEILPLLKSLRVTGYSCFLLLEPHLFADTVYSGFSGSDLFRKAGQALKNLLDVLGDTWS